jgi:hypothetical protein
MIGKSLPEYVFIRASIFAVRAITPLCIAYLAACAFQRRLFVSPWLAVYAALEAGFYSFAYLPRYARLQEVRGCVVLVRNMLIARPGGCTSSAHKP